MNCTDQNSSSEHVYTNGSVHCAQTSPTVRYDTIRDAILTCNQNPDMIQLNLYRTEPTTKSGKAEKLKGKKRLWSEVSVNSPGNPWSQPWRRKGRPRWKEYAETKGRFSAWNEWLSVDFSDLLQFGSCREQASVDRHSQAAVRVSPSEWTRSTGTIIACATRRGSYVHRCCPTTPCRRPDSTARTPPPPSAPPWAASPRNLASRTTADSWRTSSPLQYWGGLPSRRPGGPWYRQKIASRRWYSVPSPGASNCQSPDTSPAHCTEPRRRSPVNTKQEVYRESHTYSQTGGSVAEWLACWTQAQKGPGSNRSRYAVG